MNGINVRNVSRKVKLPDGRDEIIFADFSLTVGDGEVVGMFGPNGCGKTTLLNMISGILEPDSGEVSIFGRKPSEKNIAYIFQDYQSSLFPWLSVRDNILFPLSIRRTKKSEMKERLHCLTDLIKMPFNLDKYPYQLCGGQQQYVSVMRGLISDPAIMLADEPFSGLDYTNSMWLMERMSGILRKIKIPTIIVAHDIEYLFYLAGRVCFLAGKPARIIREKHTNLDHSKEDSLDYSGLKEAELELRRYYAEEGAYS
ncbi:MAG: ATP-binding cassette domain-containing protein [Candidatus Omnitrophota bacterium]|jgi:NitT/TauT family transport system ATP-binding protein